MADDKYRLDRSKLPYDAMGDFPPVDEEERKNADDDLRQDLGKSMRKTAARQPDRRPTGQRPYHIYALIALGVSVVLSAALFALTGGAMPMQDPLH